ncbi:MAG TPA: hypothetical protein VEV17_14905 [Bryobacteraceae bacterium]|nr:hypothetical protein [Bryobacteraceae bacterium]
MSKRGLIAGFLLSASLVFGQLDSNSLTVTASRNTNLQPDQVVYSVMVESGINTSLDDVIAALQGSGITAANFSGIDTAFGIILTGTPSPQPTIDWMFTLAGPLSKIKDTISTLNNVQQSIAKQNKGLKMSFSVQGTQVSPQLAQSQPCVMADLLADARAQAQNLASAAGFTVDTILAMSSVTSTMQGIRLAALLAVPPCTVTVKFALLRFQ